VTARAGLDDSRAPRARVSVGAARIAAIAAASLAALLLLSAIINQVACRIEATAYPAPGRMVEVEGGTMHLVTEGSGEGKRNLVLLSGWGSPCPALDFKPLVRALRGAYSVTVVDYFGYGWSGRTDRPRTTENIVEETREALRKASIEPPYVLMPHSLSGIYALYYANAHPEEVEAVICLDSSVPDTSAFRRTKEGFNLYGALRATGLMRAILWIEPGMAGYPPEFYSREDRDAINRMISRNMNNRTVMDESARSDANKLAAAGATFPAGLPVAMVLSDQMAERIRAAYGGLDWVEAHRRQLGGSSARGVYVLAGSHNIYWNNAERISEIVSATLGD
jgi:pimeloyl-ACP methyl ester carboxylesterase